MAAEGKMNVLMEPYGVMWLTTFPELQRTIESDAR
jgi:hypothetical protein